MQHQRFLVCLSIFLGTTGLGFGTPAAFLVYRLVFDDPSSLCIGHLSKVSIFREILANQPIGVFVGISLCLVNCVPLSKEMVCTAPRRGAVMENNHRDEVAKTCGGVTQGGSA